MTKKPYFKIKEITPGVYAFSHCGVNPYLIVGKERALLLDTGYGFENLYTAVRKVTALPLDVVLSHGHFDHAGGNNDFPGHIYIHPEEVETASRHLSPEYRQGALDYVKPFARILFWIRFIPKGLDKKAYVHSGGYDNYAFVKHGHIFDLGGVSPEVVELPGHTKGSIGLYCKEKRLLFVGDAVCPNPWLHLPESSKLSVYAEALKKTLALDFDHYLMAHNPALSPKSDLAGYLAVAENPDWEGGRRVRKRIFSVDAESRQCWQRDVRRSWKKPCVTISIDKL